ncbi:hypothetical protein LguiB_022545 [Lonicera macranthoides]
MLDPANELLPPPSPTISSVSSSDLDTESTGSFFHDRSTTLGTLMGVSFPAITFRAPSLRRETASISAGTGGSAGRRNKKAKKKKNKKASAVVAEQRRRRWWSLCRDDESKPSSLGEFLEVERRFEDDAFYGAELALENANSQPRNGRLFADGRVLPPSTAVEERTSTTAICGFPVSLTGICSGGAG